jgi:hypothetical protein
MANGRHLIGDAPSSITVLSHAESYFASSFARLAMPSANALRQRPPPTPSACLRGPDRRCGRSAISRPSLPDSTEPSFACRRYRTFPSPALFSGRPGSPRPSSESTCPSPGRHDPIAIQDPDLPDGKRLIGLDRPRQCGAEPAIDVLIERLGGLLARAIASVQRPQKGLGGFDILCDSRRLLRQQAKANKHEATGHLERHSIVIRGPAPRAATDPPTFSQTRLASAA